MSEVVYIYENFKNFKSYMTEYPHLDEISNIDEFKSKYADIFNEELDIFFSFERSIDELKDIIDINGGIYNIIKYIHDEFHDDFHDMLNPKDKNKFYIRLAMTSIIPLYDHWSDLAYEYNIMTNFTDAD